MKEAERKFQLEEDEFPVQKVQQSLKKLPEIKSNVKVGLKEYVFRVVKFKYYQVSSITSCCIQMAGETEGFSQSFGNMSIELDWLPIIIWKAFGRGEVLIKIGHFSN